MLALGRREQRGWQPPPPRLEEEGQKAVDAGWGASVAYFPEPPAALAG